MRRRRSLPRLALGLLGSALLFVVLLELGLRLLGFATLSLRRREAEQTLAGAGSAYRMLHIGESTTFGFGVAQEQAYPAVLAQRLGARHPQRRFVSYNRGIPGIVTASMRRTFADKLTELRPSLVTIMAGANDFNEELGGVRWRRSSLLPARVAELLWSSRVYKTGRLALDLLGREARLERGEVIYFRHGGSKNLLYDMLRDERQVALITSELEANLGAMITEGRSAGANVVLVGYLQSFEENRMLERIARAHGVPYVSTFVEPGQRTPDWFVADGWHASTKGHRHIADRIAEVVEPLLLRLAAKTPGR